MTDTPAQPASPATEDVKAVTQDEVVDKATHHLKKIPKIIFWGAVFFATMVPAGLVIGGIGGVAAAGYFGYGLAVKSLAAVVGVGLGGVGGFFGAQWAFKEKVGDLALNLGLDAGEMTIRSLRRLFKQAKEKAGGAEKAPVTATMERGTEKIHKGVLTLKRWFGDSAEPEAAEKPAPAPAVPAASGSSPQTQPSGSV